MESLLQGVACLYSLLGLPARGTKENKKLTEEDITRAYRRRALECHPDKDPSEEASSLFHRISAAYNVLRSPASRKRYNKDGTISPEDTTRANTTRQEDWTELFRTMYHEVGQQEVDDFYESYTGSEEEKNDIIAHYRKTKGDFEAMIIGFCMFPNESSGHVCRIRDIIRKLIRDGKLKSTKKFTETSTDKKVKNLEENFVREREEAEAEAAALSKGKAHLKGSTRGRRGTLSDLQLAVRGNDNKLEEFLSALEGKYTDLTEANSRAKKSRKR